MAEENKFYTKWWFWAIIGVVILGVIINFSSNSSNSSTDSTSQDGDIQNTKSSLEITDLSCEYGDYGWVYVKGRVKNSGNEEETFVKVNIDLYNNDEWTKSDFTYVRNTDILAGATESFEKTWADDSIIFTRCEAYATSYADSLSPTISKENNQNTQTTTTTPAVEEQSDTATIGEKNALSKALSYLRSSAFSYSGLVKQLEFEGFTYQEAVYGVDNSGADWNEQATLKAQSYLKYSAFSRQGLIDQLEFEGFTSEQAEYGVNAVGY